MCATVFLFRANVGEGSNAFAAREGFAHRRSEVELAATLCCDMHCLGSHELALVNVHTSSRRCARLLDVGCAKYVSILVQDPCVVLVMIVQGRIESAAIPMHS